MRTFLAFTLILVLLLGAAALAEDSGLQVYATLADAGVDIDALSSEGGVFRLTSDRITSVYGTDGVLIMYEFEWNGLRLGFTPYGYLDNISYDSSNADRTYSSELCRDGRAAVSLVGEIPGAVTPPDMKVYATVEAAAEAAGYDIAGMIEQGREANALISELFDDLMVKSDKGAISDGFFSHQTSDGTEIAVRFQLGSFSYPTEDGKQVLVTYHLGDDEKEASVSGFSFRLADGERVNFSLSETGRLESLRLSNLPSSAAPLSVLTFDFPDDADPDQDQLTAVADSDDLLPMLDLPPYRLDYDELSVTVYYNQEGQLEEYHYRAGDDGLVTYSFQRSFLGHVGVSAWMDSNRALYPPLEIIGEEEVFPLLLTPQP